MQNGESVVNLGTLHNYLGQLLEAGVNPEIPVTGISDGFPLEIADISLLAGSYYYDPSPKMVANVLRNGTVLALVPINEDVSDIINNKSHQEVHLPVELA